MSAPTPAPVTVKKRSSCLVIGLTGVVLVILFALVAAGAWWWMHRPIKPVNLTQNELQQVEEKLSAMRGGASALPAELPSQPVPGEAMPLGKGAKSGVYIRGSREIVLTEHELNGLLNHNTEYGNKIAFTLLPDEIQARLETDLDPEIPLVGGRTLRARARFFVTQDEKGPHFSIDDVSVWGVSLPNDWLGGLKGRDLLAETLGTGGGLPGVESIRVEQGKISVHLKE